MSVYIIGNENAALIVSDRGHFDFRVDKKSVFGKVFDSKNRDFTGKSPTFVMACGDKRVKFVCDRVESNAGSISLVSKRLTLCFTVDTDRKELLAKVISSGMPKEYVLCVSGHKVAVNSLFFDKISDKLSKATKYNRFRNRVYTDESDAQRLYLFSCFWDIFDDTHLTNFWSALDYKRLVSRSRTLCVALPGGYSEKAMSFAKNLICYSKYIKNTYGFGTDLAFFDPKGEYSRFFEQNKLKKYSKDEFELLRVCSCGTLELAMDFDGRVMVNDLLSKAPRAVEYEENASDGEKAATLRMGILCAELGKNNVKSVSFSYKERAKLCLRSLRLTVKGTDTDCPMILQSANENFAKYTYRHSNALADLCVGVDNKLPFFMMYAEKTSGNEEFSLKFSLSAAGVELSSRMMRIRNTHLAFVITPMIYENEKVSLFIIKNEDECGFSVVMGAFLGDKDAPLYKAAEQYPNASSVRLALESVSHNGLLRLNCSASDDPCQRIQKAIAVCGTDHKIAKSYIVWALCTQNIDGSLCCEGSAAKALAIYIEKSRDFEILYLELPYVCEGKYTSRKENVFMHVMRAAETEYSTEDENALEYLRKVYYERG